MSYIIAAVVFVVSLVLNQLLNLYAERWMARHQSAADRHIEWIARKASGWRWHFRWIAVLLGSSTTTLPATISLPENPPMALSEPARFADQFVQVRKLDNG
jgi:hypothetical protein